MVQILGVGKVVARQREKSHSRIPRSDPDSMDVDAEPGDLGDDAVDVTRTRFTVLYSVSTMAVVVALSR